MTESIAVVVVPTVSPRRAAPTSALLDVPPGPLGPLGPLVPGPLGPLGALELIDLLLRDRPQFLRRIEEATSPLATARALLITCLLATAAFGAAIGGFRGGIQIFYAALKLPLAVLLTAALVAPALTALGLATRASDERLDVRRRLSRDFALVLAALAIGSLVIAALTPVVVMGEMFGASYHEMALLLVGACGVGGLVGLTMFWRGMLQRSERGRLLTTFGTLLLFAVVGSQMTWSLRPFLLRPRADTVPFVRAVEGSLLDSVDQSMDSARGIYPAEIDEAVHRARESSNAGTEDLR